MALIRRVYPLLVVPAFCLAASACAGARNPSTATGSNPVTVDVLGINGQRSFSPNPAIFVDGQMVIWHNLDIYTHHVVFDDRSIDTGELRPGAWSAALPIGTTGTYHCTIHPEMLGT